MSIGNLLHASLEDAGVETQLLDERTDSQIDIEAERDAIEHIDIQEANLAMVQSLEALRDLAQSFVDKGTASNESAALLVAAMEQFFDGSNVVDIHNLGFESGDNVEVYHKHVVASMEGMIRKLGENIGEKFTSLGNTWGQLLSSKAGKAAKIIERSIELKKWFADRIKDIPEFDQPFRSGALAGIYHVDGKRPANFEAAVTKDADTVIKVIEETTKAYRDGIAGVIDAVDKAKDDEELVELIRKLKHPTSSISPSLLVKDALLISQVFEIKPGKPITTAYDFGEINASKRLVMTTRVGLTLIKALPAAMFSGLAVIIGSKGVTNAGTADKVLDAVEKYARALNSSVRGNNKIEDLSSKLATSASKAAEKGISKGAINAANSLITDMASAMMATEKSTWNHGFEICRITLLAMSSLARKINKGEAPDDVDLGDE